MGFKIRSYLKWFIRTIRSRIICLIIPKAYSFEFSFFENIRASSYADLAFKESNLRKVTHQLDKTLTFRRYKKMDKLAGSISNLSENVKRFPNHDFNTLKWCEDVLTQYKGQQSKTAPVAEQLLSPLHPDILEDIIVSRRSIRSFSGKFIDNGMVKKILQAGLWAPTGCNRQTIEFLLLENKEDIKYCQRIAGEGYPFPAEAPLAVIILVDPRNYALPKQRHMAYLEAGAAIQNMLLTARSHGIGSCWLFWGGEKNSNSQFADRFNLQSWLLPVAMVCFGYPDILPVLRPERKSIERSINYPNKSNNVDDERIRNSETD